MGLVTTLLGAYMQYKAEGDATAAKIQQDRENQQIADARAADALQRGNAEAGMIRMRAGQILGQQRASYGASGVDANVGTPASIQASSAMMGELDAQTAMNNAVRQAWGLKTYGYMYGQDAAYQAQAGQDAQYSTILGGLNQGAQLVMSVPSSPTGLKGL